MTSERLLTSPSLTPKMTARRVPDWPLRCQRSARPSRAGRMGADRRRAGSAGDPAAAPSSRSPDLGVLALVGRDRGDLGRRLGVVEVLLVALEGLDEVGHGPRPEHAGEQDDHPDPASGALGGGTSAPCSRSLPAQMSA